MVQKAIYLLQQAGVEMGYPYRWYIRGPYSSRLSNDLFYLAELDEVEVKEMGAYTLGEKTRNIVERVKDLITAPKRAGERAKRLELLASVLFIVRTGQAKPNEEVKLSEILKANGKAFEPNDAKEAVASLARNGYTF